jgi:hypothetical protein
MHGLRAARGVDRAAANLEAVHVAARVVGWRRIADRR